jgi:hypothetical protein
MSAWHVNMSCNSVEFAEEKWESVCHFIPKISSFMARTIVAVAQSF